MRDVCSTRIKLTARRKHPELPELAEYIFDWFADSSMSDLVLHLILETSRCMSTNATDAYSEIQG